MINFQEKHIPKKHNKINFWDKETELNQAYMLFNWN